jgi:aminoglycoside phosphotransferase (APT) family kinase protein
MDGGAYCRLLWPARYPTVPRRAVQPHVQAHNPVARLRAPAQALGPLIKGAHAVEREARVLRALGPTGFPVPQVYALCTDDAVIGAWFYVMDMVEGRIFWDATVSSVSGVERAAIFDSMNQVIASLHCLDPEQVGVRDFGRQANYVERQIARWSSQYFDDPQAFIRPSRESLPCLTGSCRRWAIRSSISLGMR